MKITFKSRYGALRVLTIDDKELCNDEITATLEFSDVHFIRQSESYIDPDGGPFIGIGSSLYFLIGDYTCYECADLFVTNFNCLSNFGTSNVTYELTLKKDREAIIKQLKERLSIFQNDQQKEDSKNASLDDKLDFLSILNYQLSDWRKSAINQLEKMLKKIKKQKQKGTST